MDVLGILLGGNRRSGFGLLELLPEKYAAFRPLVGDGLRFFLTNLPPERVEETIAEQVALPPRTRFPVRAETFARRFPTVQKLCQVMARDRRLDSALRRRLQALETSRSTVPMPRLAAEIRREIGSARDIRLGTRALAEGSVAAVVAFRRGRGSGSSGGVFKVLKPGIEERIGREIDLFAPLAAYLEERASALGLPEIPLVETFSGVARHLAGEVRLDLEQAHLAAARSLYADFPGILIPALLEPCTPRLTAMERVRGQKATPRAWPVGSGGG